MPENRFISTAQSGKCMWLLCKKRNLPGKAVSELVGTPIKDVLYQDDWFGKLG